MNQLQSSYQTANYRGNLLGSNASLSPDSPIPSGSSAAQNVTSQYRGIQSSFQPSGFVSSAYGQTAGGAGQLGQTSQLGQIGQFANPSSQQYHTANYRGNQPGHDNYLRSDSQQPAQQQYGIGAQGLAGNVGGIGTGISGIAGTGTSYQYGQAGQLGQTRQFGQAGQIGQFAQAGQVSQAGQYANPVAQQYHTANYRGDQPGHDDYLRSDSIVPAQRQFGIGAQGISGNVGGNIGRGIGGVAGGAMGGNLAGGVSGGNVSYLGQTTIPSAQSYHTANYRGNQPGHDNYLRSDSQQPAQQQFGIGTPSFSDNFGTGTGFTGR